MKLSPGKQADKVIHTGLIGFGLSGQVFHAPFIEVSPHFRLHSIVSTGNLAGEKYPSARILKEPEALLADPDVDLVIVATPNTLHFPLAKAALESGKHVVVEKPLTVTSGEAATLIEISKKTGKKLFPFHNRRWDGDFLTVSHLINNGMLGRVVEFESRFDRFTPEISRAAWRYFEEAGGGTLFDLGIHLIDQAVSLFGKPESVFCRLFNQRPGSVTDDSFDLKLLYPALNVTLKASVFAKEPGPRFLVHGTGGSFIKYGLDTQESMLRAGILPGSRGYGREPASQRGILNTIVPGKEFKGRYPSRKGDYMLFFEDVFQSLLSGKEAEVKPEDALLNILIIEAAKKSDSSGRTISL